MHLSDCHNICLCLIGLCCPIPCPRVNCNKMAVGKNISQVRLHHTRGTWPIGNGTWVNPDTLCACCTTCRGPCTQGTYGVERFRGREVLLCWSLIWKIRGKTGRRFAWISQILGYIFSLIYTCTRVVTKINGHRDKRSSEFFKYK